ncbi:hypothetical protein HYT55_03985 [Candidatus Woesearchaeota archaeon]|nr:hypothetical protein [Candidatus Woesearchaeota archaeon]
MKGTLKEKVKFLYEKKYKTLLLIPFLLLVFALVQISIQTATTGDFVHKGVSLKGGSTITVNHQIESSLSELEFQLQEQFPEADISIRTLTSGNTVMGFTLETNIQDKMQIDSFMTLLSSKLGISGSDYSGSDYSVEIVDSSLGSSFFVQTAWALLIAFLFMATVVFLYFRMVVPSLSVILVAFSDIVTTLAIFNLTGDKLGTGGVAAFLMLVGYSVDTEMLLNSKILKQPASMFMGQIYSAIRTGMTMTLTVLVVVFVGMVFANNETVRQIMLILFIGMLVDMVNSWILNVGLFRWHMERREKKHHG